MSDRAGNVMKGGFAAALDYLKGASTVRKALCVAVLMVVAWTSVAGAQGGPMPVPDLGEYSLHRFVAERDAIYGVIPHIYAQGLIPVMRLRIEYLWYAVTSNEL